MSSTADLISKGASALASGAKLDSNNVDSVNPGVDSSNVQIIENDSVTSSESSMEDSLPGSDEPQEDSGESKEQASSSKPQTSEKEVITVTDETGRRRKVEIDYSDRKAAKKAYELAHGARKWQAERDAALQSRKQIEQSLAEVKGNWDVMEQAYQKGGVEGLIDLLEGRPGASKVWLQKQIERHDFLKNASPEELESLKQREASAARDKELEKIRKENEEFKKQVQAERETAELRSLESRVHPAFEKHRFADKLGNPDDEHMFDEMLWNSAIKRLEPYEEQGIDITPDLIEREFRTVSSALRRRIGAQAEKKVSRVIEQKKQEATEHAQSKVMSGYKRNDTAQEARSLIQNGNLTGLLKNWGKYGSLFNK